MIYTENEDVVLHIKMRKSFEKFRKGSKVLKGIHRTFWFSKPLFLRGVIFFYIHFHNLLRIGIFTSNSPFVKSTRK